MPRISAHAFAAMSEDCYGGNPTRTTSALGWQQRKKSPSESGDGFAATLYENNGLRVLAIRGTEPEQFADLAADIQMMPAGIRNGLVTFLGALGRGGVATSAPGGAAALAVAAFLRRNFGRMPASQFDSAQQFARELARDGLAPHALTGHSLGGALAMGLSQRLDLPAVTFNAPFVGDLDGIIPMTSIKINQIVRKGCPVAGATSAMGSLPIGRVIELQFPPSPHPRVPSWLGLPGLALCGIVRLLELHSVTPIRQHLEHSSLHFEV